MKITYFSYSDETITNEYDEKSIFSIDFTDKGIIEICGKTVVFDFPALLSAKRYIARIERGPVRALFNDILGHYRMAAAQYYEQNPSVKDLHANLGWIQVDQNGKVHQS